MTGENQSPAIRLIAGLGNPGRKYAGTRHNIGFEVVDRLAAGMAGIWKPEKRWEAEVLRGDDVILLKPLTFMNLSGQAVGGVARFQKIAPEEVLIVYDDVDLPLGQLRFRASGSAGGHNGVKSVIQHLATQDFPRLKVGIGRTDAQRSMIGHVLGKFSRDETEILEKTLEDAVAALKYALAQGLEAAMNRFNRKQRNETKTADE